MRWMNNGFLFSSICSWGAVAHCMGVHTKLTTSAFNTCLDRQIQQLSYGPSFGQRGPCLAWGQSFRGHCPLAPALWSLAGIVCPNFCRLSLLKSIISQSSPTAGDWRAWLLRWFVFTGSPEWVCSKFSTEPEIKNLDEYQDIVLHVLVYVTDVKKSFTYGAL